MASIKVDVDLKDNSEEVLAAFKRQMALGLASIGEAAEGYAKDDCPVDTGRLRNSIAYATAQTHSSGSGSPAKEVDSTPKAKPEENAVYIGSNVEYAASVEYGYYRHKVGKMHFLRDAANQHGNEYEAIMKAALDA